MLVGYARVSSAGQDLTVQINQLTAAGCEKIYSEKRSGTSTEKRAELRAAMAEMKMGDVLIVTRLDRLARSLPDLYRTMEILEKRGIGFKALNQPSMDTTTSHGRLLCGILGAVAAFETEIRRERQMEGIRMARLQGRPLGRPKRIDPETVIEMGSHGMGAKEISKRLGCQRTYIYSLVPNFKEIFEDGRNVRKAVKEAIKAERIAKATERAMAKAKRNAAEVARTIARNEPIRRENGYHTGR